VFAIGAELELFGDHSATLETGDSFVVGPGVHHGIAEYTTIIDAFAPPIEEYGE
jgi:mannose-6-phosphate isomerase-like protein (cupin superfamily)